MRFVVAAALGAVLTASAVADDGDAALDLARRTLAYVGKSVPADKLKPYADELELDAKWLAGEKLPGYRAGIIREIRKLRRRILFLHPDLQFDKLLAVQRGLPYTWDLHMVDQYLGRFSRPGPGLVVLENWKDVPRKTVLLKDKLPTGTVLNPDLHWDADRIIFAFCDHTAKPPADAKALKVHPDGRFTPWMAQADPTNPCLPQNGGEHSVVHRRYFIYECAADGSWVRQLTGTPDDPMETVEGRQTVMIEDADPCYLPDGGFVFTSTRGQNFGRCHWGRYTPSFLLYRADAGGRNIRQLSFGEANEWEPSVLADGRIAYTRWDYVNRNAVWHQSLWTVRPDGTGVAHLYGNYSESVCVGTEVKSIPGSPLLVGTASAHHNFTSGSLFLLDVRKGEDGLDPITRLTPECPFPEGEGWKLGGTFCSPMPVNDTLFFCAYSDEPLSFPKGHPRKHPGSCGASWPTQSAYGIWLVDSLGGRELIYKDPEISTFNPIPLIKRTKPPVLASVLPPDATAPTSGVCYVENVYDSRVKLPPGSVKALRLNRLVNLPICRRRTPKPGPDLDLYKESLGTVPVEADGSCAFRIPSGVPIQLQALDAEGKAILTMRSFIYSQKGEIQGCAGCHEEKNASRTPTYVPKNRAVRDPVPEVDLGYTGAFSYARSVQPIFDRKCISCHGLSDKAPFSLIGIAGQTNLVARKQVSFAKSYHETHYSKPYDYFAGASPLTQLLRAGHGGAKFTPEEWRTLLLWMDFNVPEYALSSGYGWNGPDSREIDPEGEKALRAAVKERLGDAVAAQPFDALVNRGDEAKSRVLDLVGPADAPRFLALCRASLKAHPWHDIQGTCGRDDACECRSCWVRRGGYNVTPTRADALPASAAPRKKLIGHGWDLLGVSPIEVARHADELAKTGLDGISLSLRKKLPDGCRLNFSSILTDPPWTKEAFADEIAALRTLHGKPGLSHCYLSAFWTPARRLAWNDDAAWARAIGNMKVLAEIAHDTQLDGLLIDPEDYSLTKQFKFSSGDGDFESTCRLARKRGAEFIDAVASAHPRAKLLFFWLLSLSYQDFSSVEDPQQLLKSRHDLWPAFVNGMLDRLPPTMKLIDGDEHAYRYEASRRDFYASAWRQKQGSLPVVDEKNRERFLLNVCTGSGHYLDNYINPTNSHWYLGPVDGSRLNHFEQNIRQAVACADDTVWIYGEKCAWIKWRGVVNANWDSDKKSYKTWEESLPGISSLLENVRDPVGWMKRKLQEKERSGGLVDLTGNSACVYHKPLAPGQFHEGKVPKPFVTWQDEKKLQGTFGVDTGMGVGDSSSLCMKGSGNGCFVYDSPPVRQGAVFLVRFRTKGTEPSASIYWKTDGAWNWSIPGCFPAIDEAGADGWRQGEFVIQVPAKATSFGLLLGSKQRAGEKIWYDCVSVCPLD